MMCILTAACPKCISFLEPKWLATRGNLYYIVRYNILPMLLLVTFIFGYELGNVCRIIWFVRADTAPVASCKLFP